MTMNKLYSDLLNHISANLTVLEDKPEESAEATLKALWFTAHGNPMSAQQALSGELPNLDTEQVEQLQSLIAKRLQGIPLAHITGRQQFMGVELLAGPAALIPRKETELLGYAALEILSDVVEREGHALVIDVCTGAGNLPIAYAILQPAANIYAADLSAEAVSLAKQNVDYHNLQSRVEVKTGNLLDPFDCNEFYNKVDLITCNPPYISSAKVGAMHSEISDYEPRLAFDGGPFGIQILNSLIQQAPKYLKPAGWLAFEVGLGQGPSMMKFVNKSGKYTSVIPMEDPNGEIRVITVRV